MQSINSPIKIGIIGAGQNTQKVHIPKFREIPNAEILEVANRTPESTREVAEKFNIPNPRNSWQEVAASKETDAVLIGTWPYLHCEATCKALESGKHVLCEARMAMDHHEAQKMVQASRKRPELITQLVPAPFTLKFDKTISRYIRQNKLGQLLYLQANYQSESLAAPDGKLHWRRNKKYTGVNTMVLGIIYESILRWFPPAKWVVAVGKVFNKTAIDPDSGESVNIGVPDYLSVEMELANGMSGNILISEAATHSELPMILIFGDQGILKMEFKMNGKIWYGARSDPQVSEIRIPTEDQGAWRVEEEFIGAIRGKEKIKFTSFETGLEYMKFTEAVIHSCQNANIIVSLD